MSLPHALLGLINYRPATGYDLKMAFEKSIHFFWNATLPQIYRTLNQMEANGWTVSVMEHQDGKPSRKVYSLTDAGRAEFLRWLSEPVELSEARIPMLVKVFFGARLPREQFVEQIRTYRAQLAGLLDIYTRDVPASIRDHACGPDSPDDAWFWSMTLDFGVRRVRASIEWCDGILKDEPGQGKG